MWTSILVSLAAAGLALRVPAGATWRARLCAVPSAVLFVWLAADLGSWTAEPWSAVVPWAPQLGLELALRLDALSGLLALVVTGVGALVLLHAADSMRDAPLRHRFLALMLAFQASMLGVVLADGLVLLYVFWELTSVASYLLIGFDHDDEEARGNALQALLVTALGGLALLAGLLMLGHAAGTGRISELVQRADLLLAHPTTPWATALVLLGALTKSAQVPFHFWLPRAMSAPTPASAYLHAATMVKAGVYLLLRLLPALGAVALWTPVLVTSGGATLVLGGLAAVRARELKRLLAFTTLSALGLLVALAGLGDAAAVHGAVAYLLAHALYKGGLFLVAGTAIHSSGEDSLEELGGLARAMPWSAAAAVLGALSMAGVAPLLGYAAKEAVLKVAEGGGGLDLAVAAAVVVGSAGVAAASLAFARGAFFGGRRRSPDAREGRWPEWLAPLLLGAGGLAGGLAAGPLDRALLAPAAEVAAGAAPSGELALWHGVNLPFALGLAALALGLVAYASREPLARGWEGLARAFADLPARAWSAGLDGGLHGGERLIGWMHSGRLRAYLAVALAALTALMGWTLIEGGVARGLAVDIGVRTQEIVLAALAALATVATVRSRSRLAAAAALGVLGYGIALEFVFFSAPDLAMTQFVVETLVVVLFVLVFHNVPRLEPLSRPWERARDLVLAAAAGAALGAALWSSLATERSSRLAPYFLANAEEEAHGRNVVNVILTDFRAADTLGETVVLAAAALGVAAMLRRRRPREAPWAR